MGLRCLGQGVVPAWNDICDKGLESIYNPGSSPAYPLEIGNSTPKPTLTPFQMHLCHLISCCRVGGDTNRICMYCVGHSPHSVVFHRPCRIPSAYPPVDVLLQPSLKTDGCAWQTLVIRKMILLCSPCREISDGRAVWGGAGAGRRCNKTLPLASANDEPIKDSADITSFSSFINLGDN